jgi:hypothetical protein
VLGAYRGSKNREFRGLVNCDVRKPTTPIGVAPKGGKTTTVKAVNHRLGLGS